MVEQDLVVIKNLYSKLKARVDEARTRVGRPLTLTEKIFMSHLDSWPETFERGKSYLMLRPDRVAMQDATAQMALLQFMTTGHDTVCAPTTVHCDHLIRAQSGAGEDLKRANEENSEVYTFLRSASERYGIGFWQPGSGIIHQVVLEQYAFPGGMMIGTDSHTPNAGGLGMVAIGVGGADAVDVMAGTAWGLTAPHLIGVRLTGKLSGWSSPKDIILKVAGTLTVKGGTGKVVEYFGDGARSISCTGKATIANMGAELGATTSVFPFDDSMSRYLKATDRGEVAALAEGVKECLMADREVEQDPTKFYDEVIEIDLSQLKPHWVGPHTPDRLVAVSDMKRDVVENDFEDNIRYALIGSCTNSSYEDISRSAYVAREARKAGLKTKVPLMVTPGSDQVYQTIKRDGFIDDLVAVGATVLANACGPCIGQWTREDIKAGERNTIVTSYNRNFRKRNDGNAETMAFVGSPETVTAVAFAGRISFDPTTDSIVEEGRAPFSFSEPVGSELPPNGYVFSRDGYIAPKISVADRKKIEVAFRSGSDRLAKLDPFPAWEGRDLTGLLLLLKAQGKCTTDHISQAGPWLKYRGHLENISENMFLGAINFFTGEAGKGRNVLSGEAGLTFPQIAKQYKSASKGWVVVGDENYGEGSSREHAAMSPRYLGCRAVIVRSFARIHETNLKKQGVLPLTFKNPADYDYFGESSVIDILGLTTLRPGSTITVRIHNGDVVTDIETTHTFTEDQIPWFTAGSALQSLAPVGG